MKTRLRLAAASAVAVGALLLATVLASPALAWHSVVNVEAECLDNGKVLVTYTVTAWEEDHEADVDVSYQVNDEDSVDLPPGSFGEGQNEFGDQFELDAGTTGTVTVTAVAHWKDDKDTTNEDSTDLPEKCEKEEVPPPPPPPGGEDNEVPPSTEVSPSTAGAGQLPFTGASSVPMLLAGIALIGGGVLFLWSTRTRGRHASR